MLAFGVPLIREQVSHAGEIAVLGPRTEIRRVTHITCCRIFGARAAWEALTWQNIGVIVVTHQDLAGRAEIESKILRLAVGTHYGFVPADPVVILSRDTPCVIEGLLPSQDHCAIRRHYEYAAGVHEHGSLGIPIGLGANIDAVDDHVDLATSLGELDDAPQRPGDPVHILGTALHRDPGTR